MHRLAAAVTVDIYRDDGPVQVNAVRGVSGETGIPTKRIERDGSRRTHPRPPGRARGAARNRDALGD